MSCWLAFLAALVLHQQFLAVSADVADVEQDLAAGASPPLPVKKRFCKKKKKK